jgi:pimeloyl-ACP methyl ester carboxylesterase
VKKLIRLWVAFVILSLASCGEINPPHPTPEPDSVNPNFLTEEVRLDTGVVTLTGTLLLPFNNTPTPALIIIPGSGAATRNGSWNMYRSIGEYLVQRGIAVLLYDKRGVDGSTGNWESETFDERAQDVTAMLMYLQNRAEIDPKQIGLIGHSQGAYIAPLVVAKYSNAVKFVVLLAGSGQKVWDQILTNERAESRGNGLSESKVNKKVSGLESQLQFIQKVQSPCRTLKAHYLCFVLDYDPTPALEKLIVPTLALYAELDTQVPPDVNIPLVESALTTAGNSDFTIYTYKKANHWFAQVEIGTTKEMRELTQHGKIDRYEFVPGFLDTLGDWVTSQVLIHP